ncbi:MAG: hypothetical protein OEV99_17100 [Nitrospira sp.]|nr:hypothetical protein [Nitrospira sp.]MDH4371539.1 hypothetical protein [Nitrospira sp.]MDH5498932.1 hypothetical protein [Nitrospira sp.]
MLQSDSTLELMTEQQFIKKNLAVIRAYLKTKFPRCVITEESNPSLYHTFTVRDEKVHHNYRLKVGWPRLSDRSNTQEKTKTELGRVDVARCMIQAGDDWFYW